MGWKNVREHYRLPDGMIVKVVEGALHVGTGFMGDIVVVDPEGRVARRDRGSIVRQDPYRDFQEAVEADPAVFARLMADADRFGPLLPVYRREGGAIVERRCERRGWPNVTTDGELMHDNVFYATPEEARARALASLASHVEADLRLVAEAEDELARRRDMLERDRRDLAQMEGGDWREA